MKTEETNPAHWLMFGAERLRAADALFAALGITPSVVELLQESVERYLKGYLIAQAWPLQKSIILRFCSTTPYSSMHGSTPFLTFVRNLPASFGASIIPALTSLV